MSTKLPTKISDLKPAPYNPRKISAAALEGLKASLKSFGDLSGIVFNKRSGHVVAGHQRIKALTEEYGEEVRLEDGNLLIEDGQIPVRVVDWDEVTEKAANVAANNPHIQGSFTDEIEGLLHELKNETIFEDINLDELLEEVRAPNPIDVEEDEIPESVETRTKPGDIWHLGHHKLACGDACNPELVKRLFSDRQPFMIVTDPPYGVEYDPKWRENYDTGKRRSGKVENDGRIDWSEAFSIVDAKVIYVWCAGLYLPEVATGLDNQLFERRALIIWKKQHFVMSRGAYHWQHESCWYAVKKGASAKWIGDRKQSTIWEINNHNSFGGQKEDADTNHSTQKPVECMLRPIQNHGEKGDLVYDPFLGSGTSIIAAEQSERICYGIELNPEYCDIILSRWERFTGCKAERSA